MHKQNILVVRNPKAGQGSRLYDDTLDLLRRSIRRLEVIETQKPGDAEEIARKAAESRGWDALAVAGGDGTLNEAANGLIGSDLPMGIIPVGTANVLAKEISMPNDAKGVSQILQKGSDLKIHPGIINGRVFLLMVGAGFDGIVASGISEKLKSIVGPGAYVFAALKEVFSNATPMVEVETDGMKYSATWAVVSNISLYGGFYRMAPSANLETPGFIVTLFNSASPFSKVRDLLAVAVNRNGAPWGAKIIRASNARLSGGLLQVDGDSYGSSTAELEVSSKSMNLIIPKILVKEKVRFKSPVECSQVTSSVQG